MAAEPGTKLGRYEILSKVGAGGMGEVYLAEDTRLHRKVALKILPTELAANKDRMRRFEQEAQAAAALNHPNIAHIYEISERGGVNFIAMEFVDGVTLREKIHGERAELKKLLRFLQHAAEGLAKAHAAAIVHRDLKPDNIMITRDGHAKILDFGLAKLIEQTPMPGTDSSEVVTAVMPQHSTPGTVMGTVGYMSPEQAQGKTKEIDQRSDVFSFGCILFEAATGKKPFEGESIIKSLHMVVYEPAPPLVDLNPAAPAELQRIVRRCLAKDPDERYQSIKEVAIELKGLRRELAEDVHVNTTVPPARSADLTSAANSSLRETHSHTEPLTSLSGRASSAEYFFTGIKGHKVATAIVIVLLIIGGVGLGLFLRARNTGVKSAISSIAVMPFVNASGNADVEYLSDGITDTLIAKLSQLPNLNVKARSSVFHYKGKDADAKTIGRELNVQAVLNGRVQQRGDEVTLTLELVDAQTENVIWSEQYTRRQADLISLQSEIARDVVTKLRSKLSGADEQKLAKTYTNNPEAYQLYLKGSFYLGRRTAADMKRALEYFQQAIDLDPNYALAYVGLSDAYKLPATYGLVPTREGFPRAKAAAQKALQIDESLAAAHAALGDVAASYDWDWTTAEREFKRAMELDPNSGGPHLAYAFAYLCPMRRFDEAVSEAKRAQELEPLSLNINLNLGAVLTTARRYDEAIAQLRKTVESDPTVVTVHWRLALAYSCVGRHTEAIAEAKRALELAPDLAWSKSVVAQLSARAGDKDMALKLIEEIKKMPPNNTSYMIAIDYACLGQKDQAFEWLNKAYESKDWSLNRVGVEPWIDNIGSDPRLADLVRRMGLKP